MSIKVMSYVWECSQHKGSELIVLLAIADYADDDGKAFPSIPALARKARITERNIQYVLKKLTQSKALRIHEGKGPNGCHMFQVNIIGVQSFQGEKFSPEKISPGSQKSECVENDVVNSEEVQSLRGAKFSGVKSFQVKNHADFPPPLDVSPPHTPPLLNPPKTDPSEKTTSPPPPLPEEPWLPSDDASLVKPPKRKRERVAELTPQQLINLWNDQAPDEVGAVRVISQKRLDKAARYLKRFPERAFWEKVIQEIHNSDFLCGVVNKEGHKGFKADFDWIFSVGRDGTENCVKVWEGKYRGCS